MFGMNLNVYGQPFAEEYKFTIQLAVLLTENLSGDTCLGRGQSP
jgi:hypothetical protein